MADPQVVNELLSCCFCWSRNGDRLDTTSRAETGKVEFEVPGIRSEGVQAVDIEMARDGATAYVALGPANRVAEVDAKTLAVPMAIPATSRSSIWRMRRW
ncbi:hypothetical protein [Mesorhizobium sp. B2-7-3]|uniref:hypothetical protein n=1 Tax=Mesorhizobium sp. B2-7-3 TaxID=2589907 RepID=UPI001FEF036B|nr:hypothetical protein [Mesorhizobium sp. B2-7-3]